MALLTEVSGGLHTSRPDPARPSGLVQAAMALWRTNGYANTTVADICRAAGVSKALFYFYFPRKEDVLFDVGVFSTQAAQRTVHELLGKPYEISPVVDAALTTLDDRWHATRAN